MEHHFNTEIARKFGVDGAIIIHNIYFWIKKNEANKKHLHDKKYWTYNSISAFCELFPYWSKRQIERILSNLLKDGAVLKENYNEIPYDRTSWYTITETVKSIYANGEMDLRKRGNGFTQTGTPIPYSKQQIENTDSNKTTELKNSVSKKDNTYSKCVEVWLKEIHPDFQFGAVQGKKIKSIISKIKESNKKTGIENNEDNISKTFRIICQNLPDWFKDKDLKDIDANYNSIIKKIKDKVHGNTEKTEWYNWI